MDKKTSRVIGKYFIRVVKDNDLYHIFKKNFNNGYNFLMSENNMKCANKDIITVNDFFDAVGDDRIKIPNMNGNENKFNLVTNIVNKYLHYFLESAGVKPFKLGQYGQMIFDLSCSKLFGSSYADELPKLESSIPQPKNEKELLLISNYLHYINDENGNLEFKDFIKKLDRTKGTEFYSMFYDN